LNSTANNLGGLPPSRFSVPVNATAMRPPTNGSSSAMLSGSPNVSAKPRLRLACGDGDGDLVAGVVLDVDDDGRVVVDVGAHAETVDAAGDRFRLIPFDECAGVSSK